MKEKTNKYYMAMREAHVPRAPYNITPIFVERAHGALITDVDGKEYIDFGGGIGCQNVGHCRTEVVSAIKEQAKKNIHTCFHLAMYGSYVELAKRLNELTPGNDPKKTFFVNSGAEAVENAVKIARYAKKRHSIVAFENAYHGRTYMAMTLTSQAMPYKGGFGPLCPEVYRLPFAYCYRCPLQKTYPECDIQCALLLEKLLITSVAPDDVAAVIIEPVQGEGGFVVPPSEYLKRIQNICQKHGILFVVDEIQTGMGRTGKLFASEYFNVSPDIILTGKSLAAGLPLAGVTGKMDLMDAPHVGGLGGTFSGNPIACSSALVVLDLLDEELLGKAMSLGKRLKEAFLEFQKRFELIGDVRGLGPMIGVELVKDRKTKEPAVDEAAKLVRRCCEKGLVILSCGVHRNFIRTLAPLVITDDQVERGLDILGETFSELMRGT